MVDRILLISIVIATFLLLIVGLFFYFLRKGHRQWKEKVKQTPVHRQLGGIQYFVDCFSKKGYSVKTSEFIYEQTQMFLKAEGLVLLPQDDLINLYERKQEEWFCVFNKWFDVIGKNHPDKKTLDDLLTKHKQINFEYLHDLLDKHV